MQRLAGHRKSALVPTKRLASTEERLVSLASLPRLTLLPGNPSRRHGRALIPLLLHEVCSRHADSGVQLYSVVQPPAFRVGAAMECHASGMAEPAERVRKP